MAATIPACAVLPGCREQDPRAVAAVRDVLVRWHGAMLAGDRQTYLNCYTGTDEMLRLEAARLELHTAAMGFRDRYIAEYGREAWQDHQDTAGASLGLPPESAEYPHLIEIRIKDGYALLTWPDSPRNRMFEVKKTDQGWKLVAGQWLGYTAGGRGDIPQTMQLNLDLAEAIRDIAKRIGQPGYTARRVTEQLAERMQAIGRGES
ncbi:MAG: hypothetical protein ACOCZE_10300 [Planctomycetota bacterium]